MPRLALWTLCAVPLLAVMDTTAVVVALPAIQDDLGFSVAGAQWILNAYTLTMGGLLLLSGRVADLLGRRRVFLWGVLGFAGWAVVAAWATAPWMLVAARVGQGAAAAAMVPTSLSLLTTAVGAPRARERAVGIYGAMLGVGFLVGVVAGGLATQALGWRSVLLLNVPVAVALAPLALATVAEQKSEHDGRGLDVAGALTLVGGLALVIHGLLAIEQSGGTWASTFAPLGAGLTSLAAFVAIERRARVPLVPLGIFRIRHLAAANAANTLKSAVGMAQLYLLTLFLQRTIGATPLQTGLAFAPMALVAIVAGVLTGRFMHRIGGTRHTAIAGCAVLATGLALIAVQVRPGASVAAVIPGMLLAETGFTVASVPLTIVASTALARRRGLAAGILNTSGELGHALGLGITAAIVSAARSSTAAAGSPAALAGGLRLGLAATAAMAGLALAVVGIGIRGRHGQRTNNHTS